ncbi:MAG: hypothetical protein AB8B55_11965 [Mariniblastus sp.]
MKLKRSTKLFLPLTCLAVLSTCAFSGCQQSDGLIAASESAVKQNPKPAETTTAEQAPEEKSMLDQASDIFGKAATTSGETASGASKWVQDKIGSVAEAGSQASDDSMKWANETFESLKKQGLTTASDTGEWLTQDWRNMESWEYEVKDYSNADPEMLVKELNAMGKRGWDCFSVQGTRHYFKKPTHSYLRQLPFKDMLRLIPLMDKQP